MTPRRSYSSASFSAKSLQLAAEKNKKAEVKVMGFPAAVFQFGLIGVVSIIAVVVIVYTPDKRTSKEMDILRIKAPKPRRLADAGDEGGWRMADKNSHITQLLTSSVCNIDTINADKLSLSDFKTNYEHKKPVILSFKKGSNHWVDVTKWSRDILSKEHGGVNVMVGRSEEHAYRLGVGGTGSDVNMQLLLPLANFLTKHLDMEEDCEPL